MQPTYRKRNSPIYLHMSQACSFDGGRQGCRFSENSRDRSGEGFLCTWLRMNTFCALDYAWTQSNVLCSKVFAPSSKSIPNWGTASSSGMKNSCMTSASTSQNTQDDQALQRREWCVSGRPFNTANIKPQKQQVSHVEKFFTSVCGWNLTS